VNADGYSESDLLPLSGLQHLAFCERRWALVQIESIWNDNRFTAEGNALHERAHSGEIESRPGALIRRTLLLHSFRLGVVGQADVVEFQPSPVGVQLEGRRGRWTPFPIEYKRTRDKAASEAYHVQLCAQALCLEEMLGCSVPHGAIYDGAARRRQSVSFTPDLRSRTEGLAARMHFLFNDRRTPPPVFTNACKSCSLLDDCYPGPLCRGRSATDYLKTAIDSSRFSRF
jgi:CRISPR-associated exonuclease Cas4